MADDSPSLFGPEPAARHNETGAPGAVSGKAPRSNTDPNFADPNLAVSGTVDPGVAGLVAQLTGVERRLKSTLSRLQRITRKIARSASSTRSASNEPAPVLEIMLNGVCRARLELPDAARLSSSPTDLTGKIQHL